MRVLIGRGSCGEAAGAGAVSEILHARLSAAGSRIPVEAAGCVGACYLEPIVTIEDGGAYRDYVKVDTQAAEEIAKMLCSQSSHAGDYLMHDEDARILNKYTKIALRNCGRINPESIKDYIASGGYSGFPNNDIIEEIKLSGLAGRGGAGFPTWFKWRAIKDNPNKNKTIIANADEGDPGAFMDRAILEGDPHSVIEGMLICAYAVGANEGVIYVRAEYPLAIKRLEAAIAQAGEKGFIGSDCFGSGFSFHLRIKEGAGAFVCGEETALIASLEGERGMPRFKPPFPAEKGYFQNPTNINNVETFANVPWIIKNGGAAFAAIGTESSKGSKVFALTGKIKKGGLVEVPMGLSLRECIFDMGGGIKDDKAFKAVQLGGPSGGCLPESLLDTAIDYKLLAQTGAIMGSGGMVVMDESTCIVDMARFFLEFTCKESCGKCTHCRIGTKRMLEILERIVAGNGKEGDMAQLEELAARIKDGALCGLGQSAPNPVLTSLEYFRNEFEDHIYHKKCTAGQCRALIKYIIDEAKCTGCALCVKKCRVSAISGKVKEPHIIDNEKCVKCGVCEKICKFEAVSVK